MKKQHIEKEKIEVDSKKKSALETIADVVLGFLIFLPVNYFVLPIFVDQIAEYSIIGMLAISAIFTSISLVRKYTVRRWFENRRQIELLVIDHKKKGFICNLSEKLGGIKI
tara:strand:+ start:49 stop:381 length:333 start_codon:yes stop_codon:yes gene_type:complete